MDWLRKKVTRNHKQWKTFCKSRIIMIWRILLERKEWVISEMNSFYVNANVSLFFQVRWADLEERKEQEKMRAVGFVVGHTNWDRMMDPTKGESALIRTKYIWNKFFPSCLLSRKKWSKNWIGSNALKTISMGNHICMIIFIPIDKLFKFFFLTLGIWPSWSSRHFGNVLPNTLYLESSPIFEQVGSQRSWTNFLKSCY